MRLGHLLAAAGWPMLPIYACSVLAVAAFARKLWTWRRLGLERMGWLEPVLASLSAGALERAASEARGVAHPAARAAAAAIAVLPRRPDRARAEGARVASEELQRFESSLGLLSFTAQAAPLLGLLGTVIGMVGVFIDMGQGADAAARSVDVGHLSSGIWTALLTTAAGLIVAVPTLAAHGYLSACAERLRLRLHDTLERVLTAAPPAGATDAAASPTQPSETAAPAPASLAAAP
ncbi:MotA/TolQ/ExbB proton channel family protein [Haliangium ochraceum]|uniref:MotA/TolQ/ExbB proton channel n=1 Tax=Haliangium ochraceum (strain DSM 14365 / JCM 11303 / SMP-2) TaxID=502025 RepID=D0LWG1_HALO1|nr:MotA/TolQ/ExbB proton channel family protein [Haliangium ochraceum]ACY17611.1 MotA/TolQ/ExbB proton channel [Haliangium ochraceum DSM 14365]